MTGKTSPRVGEARDTATSHYVFEAPVRLWHWLTVGCMLVLMVTGYFIGRPLPSVSGEATYLFYMGDIRLVHFAAAMVFTVILLMRIYWAFVGNRYSRELFIVPVWRRSWWQGAYSVVRWYLFLEKKPGDDIGHNPIAQAAMCGYSAFIVGHVYMAIREDIMSDETVISTMINGFRSHKFPKGQHDKEAS